MLRIIREEEPPKPSTQLEQQRNAAVRRRQPQHGTSPLEPNGPRRAGLDRDEGSGEGPQAVGTKPPTALAHDVERYLHDEPVEACPPSAVYRFRKFARRQKTGLVIATVLTLALLVVLGGVAGSIGWAVRDRASRQAAIEVEVNLALKEATRLQAQRKYAEALSAALRRGAFVRRQQSGITKARWRPAQRLADGFALGEHPSRRIAFH